MAKTQESRAENRKEKKKIQRKKNQRRTQKSKETKQELNRSTLCYQSCEIFVLKEKDLKVIREAKIREEMLDREASLRQARAEASLSDGISWVSFDQKKAKPIRDFRKVALHKIQYRG
ncbi:hypothetical protein V6Z11_D13G172300 [Gossypium hirsutum]